MTEFDKQQQLIEMGADQDTVNTETYNPDEDSTIATVTSKHVLLQILEMVKSHGEPLEVRGLKTLELVNFHYILQPRDRFMCFDERKLKLDYIKQEFLWYLLGDKFDVSIGKLATMWQGLINGDGSINSNYGYYIFNPEAADGKTSNFLRVAETLKQDPASRRAVITILGNEHLNTDTKDYPCTAYINFLIREDALHILVRMRSQDAIYGMGNDAPFFSLLHELMWVTLKGSDEKFANLELGEYWHTADSFHVYERHFEMLDKIIENPKVSHDMHKDCPHMTVWTPNVLQQLVVNILTGKPFDEVKGKDAFVDWLLTRDDPETLVRPEKVAA